MVLGALALASIAWAVHGASTDFEVTGPDGRRILLKEDKTWRYLETEAKKDPAEAKKTAEAKDAPAEKPKDPGEAVLYLDGRIEGNRTCRFQVRLVNNLPYEIRSLVPEFSVFRNEGVVYDSVFQSFQFLKPGDTQRREVRLDGLACQDIMRVRVGGGDRCEMGELDKFSPGKGKCLALVRVVASEVVRFDK